MEGHAVEIDADVIHDDEDIRVLAETLERLKFDEFHFSIETRDGRFDPYLDISGAVRDARDFSWAIVHLIETIGTIGWTVDRTQASPETGSATIFFSTSSPALEPDPASCVLSDGEVQ